MYSATQLAAKYIRYWFTARNSKGHGMHSPFVFDFITRVLNDKKIYEAYSTVENSRQRLLRDETLLQVEDMGAGSVKQSGYKRTVKSIARSAAKPAKYGQLLYRMIQYYKPETVVELGTSLGITTRYLALANPEGRVITMEGAAEVAAIAKNGLASDGVKNVRIKEGNFDHTLQEVINESVRIDFAFVDGNHRQEPTVRYFSQLLPALHADSILVFDDIHWSREMEDAWEEIKKNPAVTCTLDLFFIGIVFFRKEFYEKQHFLIRF